MIFTKFDQLLKEVLKLPTAVFEGPSFGYTEHSLRTCFPQQVTVPYPRPLSLVSLCFNCAVARGVRDGGGTRTAAPVLQMVRGIPRTEGGREAWRGLGPICGDPSQGLPLPSPQTPRIADLLPKAYKTQHFYYLPLIFLSFLSVLRALVSTNHLLFGLVGTR